VTGRKRERITLERLEHKWGRPFGAIYHELRVVRGLDMEAVARECGVSRQTIWKWLREMEQEHTQAASATTDAA
jgi:AcrR family transcriptional regulator